MISQKLYFQGGYTRESRNSSGSRYSSFVLAGEMHPATEAHARKLAGGSPPMCKLDGGTPCLVRQMQAFGICISFYLFETYNNNYFPKIIMSK